MLLLLDQKKYYRELLRTVSIVEWHLYLEVAHKEVAGRRIQAADSSKGSGHKENKIL